MKSSFYTSLYELESRRQSFVVVSLISIRGSAPQEVGAKILVTQDGYLTGTIGGGKLEAFAITHAQHLLNSLQTSEFKLINLQIDIGMSCGGEVGLFFDVQHFQSWNIALFGAGHISQELTRIMSSWSAQISVFDSRPEWLNKTIASKNITTHLLTDITQTVNELPNDTYLLCMTQGHSTDLPILIQVFNDFKKYKMIGCIGSKIKAQKLKKELKIIHPNLNAIDHLLCPLGLPIGDNTPPEIAISICAQILQIKNRAC